MSLAGAVLSVWVIEEQRARESPVRATLQFHSRVPQQVSTDTPVGPLSVVGGHRAPSDLTSLADQHHHFFRAGTKFFGARIDV